MLNETKLDSPEAIQLLGECHPLLEQLGSADGLFTLTAAAASLCLPKVTSIEALAQFLEGYQSRILLPVELPAIYRAHQHASRNECAELIKLDRDMPLRAVPGDFASASRRVGRNHLQRLRPLRDARIVQRYLDAVEDKQAYAWHTVVYGLTLALFSFPVWQGLTTYAVQTLRGFIQAAARPIHLSVAECGALFDKVSVSLPAKLEAVIQADKFPPQPPA